MGGLGPSQIAPGMIPKRLPIRSWKQGGSKQKQNMTFFKGASELRSKVRMLLRGRPNVHASGCNWRICGEQWEQLSGCLPGTQLLKLKSCEHSRGCRIQQRIPWKGCVRCAQCTQRGWGIACR